MENNEEINSNWRREHLNKNGVLNTKKKLYETCVDGKINMCKCLSIEDCIKEAGKAFDAQE